MTPSLLLVLALLASDVEAVTLSEEAWNVASPAGALAGQEPVRRLVQALETRPEAILVIRHAGGEAGSTRAVALQAALVALGVPSARLRREPAAAPPRFLVLELEMPGLR